MGRRVTATPRWPSQASAFLQVPQPAYERTTGESRMGAMLPDSIVMPGEEWW